MVRAGPNLSPSKAELVMWTVPALFGAEKTRLAKSAALISEAWPAVSATLLRRNWPPLSLEMLKPWIVLPVPGMPDNSCLTGIVVLCATDGSGLAGTTIESGDWVVLSTSVVG